jgi:hypothetical protein
MRTVFRVLTIFPLMLAVLACASFPNLTIPSLATATARAALTATVQGGGDYQTPEGLLIGSYDTTEKAINDNAPYLEALAEERYDTADLSQAGETYVYTINLPEEQTLIWQTNWCTTTEELLNQNMEHFQLQFTVNGDQVDPGHIAIYEARSDDLYCAYFFASLSNWPQGTTVLNIDIAFTEPINDGMADYPEGIHTYKYVVTLEE